MKVDPHEFKLDEATYYDKSQQYHAHRGDSHVCVDSTPPELLLEPTMVKKKQGDPKYSHDAPAIIDKNKGGMRRQIKKEQDEALVHTKHLKRVGTFAVNYTLTVPWLPEEHGRKVRAARLVVVDDVDECSYAGDDDDFRPMCFVMEASDHSVANATCTNIVMRDDNIGPGYTCSCPEGYEGNAFGTSRSFQAHREAKADLRALYDAELEDASSDGDGFETWLQTTRGIAPFAAGPHSDKPDEPICRDVRAPTLKCATDPCPVIELEAANVEAVVLKKLEVGADGRVGEMLPAGPESCATKMDFVNEIIQDQRPVERFCGKQYERCLDATDYVWKSPTDTAGPLSYQADIKLLSIEPATEEEVAAAGAAAGAPAPDMWFCGPIHFTAAFAVADAAGNRAEQKLTLTVMPMNMTKMLSDPAPPRATTWIGWMRNLETTFSDRFIMRFVPAWMRRGVLALLVTTLVVILSIQGALIRDTLMGGVRATQYLLFPYSLVNDREAFDRAVTFTLWVRSLGTFWHWTDHEIDTRLEEAWQELQLKVVY